MATIYIVTHLYYNFMTTAQQFYRFWPVLGQKRLLLGWLLCSPHGNHICIQLLSLAIYIGSIMTIGQELRPSWLIKCELLWKLVNRAEKWPLLRRLLSRYHNNQLQSSVVMHLVHIYVCEYIKCLLLGWLLGKKVNGSHSNECWAIPCRITPIAQEFVS